MYLKHRSSSVVRQSATRNYFLTIRLFYGSPLKILEKFSHSFNFLESAKRSVKEESFLIEILTQQSSMTRDESLVFEGIKAPVVIRDLFPRSLHGSLRDGNRSGKAVTNARDRCSLSACTGNVILFRVPRSRHERSPAPRAMQLPGALRLTFDICAKSSCFFAGVLQSML